MLPFPFPPLPSLSSPSLPCHEAAPEHHKGSLGSAASSPSWVQGQSPVCKHILVYFELENLTWQQHFWLFSLA